MGFNGPAWFPDLPGAIFCLVGLIAQYRVCRRFGLSKRLNVGLVLCLGILFVLLQVPHRYRGNVSPLEREVNEIVPAAILLLNLVFLPAAALMLLFRRIPAFSGKRRGFLRASSLAACAVPAAVLGAGIITRKDFRVVELDIPFAGLPDDLHGLRLLQISDIHLSSFFSRNDLRRVIDASNGMNADVVFVTGDLITTRQDPLDECLAELQRLRSASGIWGCMGNHEWYARCQTYTKRAAHRIGIDFLRYENRLLNFGASKLNLIGVDYQFRAGQLPAVELLRNPDAFNLLLSHTPAVFPLAAQKGMDLTLSGHTHGGQINVEIAGTNFNLVEATNPFTKGLYRRGNSAVYVNSGLGTIGIPVRIGAPPEITVIRLCKS